MKALLGKKVYLDANVFIYAVESPSGYRQIASSLFTAIEKGSLIAVTSELTLGEVLVMPFAKGARSLIELYKTILVTRKSLQVNIVSREILVAAAKLRAEYKSLKTPDAIHLATAITCSCEVFVSNDFKLKTGSIPFVSLDALSA